MPFTAQNPSFTNKVRVRSTIVGNESAGITISLLLPIAVVDHVLDAFERLLWWLFAGSAGAKTRALVLNAIREEPRNAQQLSEALSLDYTTVRHHLKVLEQNRIVVTEGNSYGKLYFVSDSMEAHWQNLQSIMERTKGRK